MWIPREVSVVHEKDSKPEACNFRESRETWLGPNSLVNQQANPPHTKGLNVYAVLTNIKIDFSLTAGLFDSLHYSFEGQGTSKCGRKRLAGTPL